jgi:hypothetical protein
MKKLLVAIAFLLISNTITSQSVATKEIETIKQLVQDAFDDVWSKYDSSKLKTHHTNDFMLLENGHVWNNDTIANYQAKGLKRPARKRINSFDFIKFEQYGTSIWAAYHNYATFTGKDGKTTKAQWLESIVAIKTETGWKLKMMHSTWVPIKSKD